MLTCFYFQKHVLTVSAIIILSSSTFISLASAGDTDTITSECNEVYWKISSKTPLIFGEDISLICKTTYDKDLCTQCSKMWFGGPALTLLSLDGFPTKSSSKYWPTIGKDRFEIIIKKFNREDLNKDYICSIGEYSCKRNLTIDKFDKLDKDISEDNASSRYTRVILPMVLSIGSIVLAIVVILISIKIFIKVKKKKKKLPNIITSY